MLSADPDSVSPEGTGVWHCGDRTHDPDQMDEERLYSGISGSLASVQKVTLPLPVTPQAAQGWGPEH